MKQTVRIWVHRQAMLILTALVLFAAGLSFAADKNAFKDPELTIPFCKSPPKIDGKLSPGEWDFAAAIGMLEAYPCNSPRAMRQEQPTFYVFRDAEFLYIAMESLDSNTTGIIGACSMHDNEHIIADDCVEFMIAPGVGEQAVTAILTPSLKALGVDASRLQALDAETDEAIPLKESLAVKVERHDVRLILIAPAGAYPKTPAKPAP